MTYRQIIEGLTPESEELYREMVEAHLASKPGSRRFQVWGSLDGTLLSFSGSEPFERDNVDETAVNDLASYGLLRRVAGGGRHPVYEISAESLKFYRALMEYRGGPISAVEKTASALVNSQTFAKAHPRCAAHLSEAFERLWSDRVDSATVASLGHDLRSALIDIVEDKMGGSANTLEDVPRRIDQWSSGLTDRESTVVGDLVKSAWRLAQRLTHIEDETTKGRPLRGHDELRRAAFAVVCACYEVTAI